VAKSGASLITPQKPATAQGALSQKRTVLWKRVDDRPDSPREPCVLKVAAASAVPAAAAAAAAGTATARCSRSCSNSSVGDTPAVVEVVPAEAEAAGLLLHAAVSQANLQHAISESKQTAAVCELKPATVALAVAAQTALAAGVPVTAATAAAGGCDSPLLLCCAKEDDVSSADDNSPAGSMEPLDCSPVPAADSSTATTAAAASPAAVAASQTAAKPAQAAPKGHRWWLQDGVPLLSRPAVVVQPRSEKCALEPSSVYVSRAAAFENDTCAAAAAAAGSSSGSSGRSTCTSPTLQQQRHAQQQRAL
jgi:hypothetical protein